MRSVPGAVATGYLFSDLGSAERETRSLPLPVLTSSPSAKDTTCAVGTRRWHRMGEALRTRYTAARRASDKISHPIRLMARAKELAPTISSAAELESLQSTQSNL